MENPKLIDKWFASLTPGPRHAVRRLLRIAEARRLSVYLVGGPLRDLLLGRPSLDIDLTVESDAIALARDLAGAAGSETEGERPHGTARHVENLPPGATGRPADEETPHEERRWGEDAACRGSTVEGSQASGLTAGEERPAGQLRVAAHPAFGTATIRGSGFHIDLATARSETYKRPGALPTVAPGSIEDDLLRRDFSINAMALRLTGGDAGQVLDPASGRADLETGLVRALHERSFQDDATRILRAARYEARFGFRTEPATERWMRRDAGYLRTISGPRLRHELLRIFAEETPETALRRLAGIAALPEIHPSLGFGPASEAALQRLRAGPARPPAPAFWALLARPLSEAQAEAVAARLALTAPERAAVRAAPALRRLKARLADPGLLPSETVRLLSPFPAASVRALAAAASGAALRERCLRYLEEWRQARPALRGDDVIRLGVPAGPLVGEALEALKAAKLDGRVRGRRDEERLIAEFLRRRVPAGR
jgi:tRNA nucleotidyltransferase (CCA-adding enzyme)